jgi:hypothetical protein
MAVLTHPVAWRREARRDVEADLSPQEQQNVRKALRSLAKRFGTYAKLATAMRAKEATVMKALYRGPVSAGVALRASRAAKVPLEDILTGAWPKPGMCPYCGRC